MVCSDANLRRQPADINLLFQPLSVSAAVVHSCRTGISVLLPSRRCGSARRSPLEEGRLTVRPDNQFSPIASGWTACSAWAGFAKGGPSPQIPKPLLWATLDAST